MSNRPRLFRQRNAELRKAASCPDCRSDVVVVAAGLIEVRHDGGCPMRSALGSSDDTWLWLAFTPGDAAAALSRMYSRPDYGQRRAGPM